MRPATFIYAMVRVASVVQCPAKEVPPSPPERTFIWSSHSEAEAWAARHDLCVYAVEDGFATSRCHHFAVRTGEAVGIRLSDRRNFGQYFDCIEWLPKESVLQSCEGADDE